eukprot:Polyplicarium_translucidae@DN2405_c0_g1_i3.p2
METVDNKEVVFHQEATAATALPLDLSHTPASNDRSPESGEQSPEDGIARYASLCAERRRLQMQLQAIGEEMTELGGRYPVCVIIERSLEQSPELRGTVPPCVSAYGRRGSRKMSGRRDYWAGPTDD